MDSTQLFTSGAGMAATEAVHLSTSGSATNTELVVKIVVQVAIGIVTLISMLRHRKQANP